DAPLFTGVIAGTIVSETYVHVASGLVEPLTEEFFNERGDLTVAQGRQHTADDLVAPHMRTIGLETGKMVRVLPGSTLKGLIRSAVEAITNPGNTFAPVREARKIKNEVTTQTLDASVEPPELSLANRLFGLTHKSRGYQSHCTFYDACQHTGGAEIYRRLPLYGPRPESAGYQFYFKDANQKEFRGRKFYRREESLEAGAPYIVVEACKPNSSFDFRMQFRALSEVELGVLLIALGAEHTVPALAAKTIPYLKVGGGKSVSFGTIQFKGLHLNILDTTAYADFEAKEQPHDIVKCVEAAHNGKLLYTPGFTKLRKIMNTKRTNQRGGSSQDTRIY
ncbi:MAG: RAMP superfamily CRISPR-associated protein, partial [Chloroflexales bacterium]|nr:RAMP superfamily CRISPR-associated protein [Chloroflexales bacterium]